MGGMEGGSSEPPLDPPLNPLNLWNDFIKCKQPPKYSLCTFKYMAVHLLGLSFRHIILFIKIWAKIGSRKRGPNSLNFFSNTLN